ncbi:Gag-pro-like protein [Cucumis melo var. makuwa]|uniref:Gag-pro-like protein n=1 Tax=Cucumis melo var. makuwa TaxID=1194695 RepID=A0A5D3DYU5_CUCMM|nr:Gag-pro-like protein [Cucumis melo var. makuwa]
MSIDFMMWKDEYETLRRKYDDAIGRMERGAEKLRQMASMADQFSMQARTLRQELLTTGRGKSVVGTSSQVEVDLNQVLEDMPAYPPGFTPQRSYSPRMVDRTYPTSFFMPNSNTTTQQAAHVSNPISTPTTESGKKISEEQSSRKRLEFLEERLCAIEGADMYGSIDATQLCLISDVVIPPKFKILDFEKYNGTTCPKSHLVMYCRKMSAYARDDKLLIYCFQESLVGSASR